MLFFPNREVPVPVEGFARIYDGEADQLFVIIIGGEVQRHFPNESHQIFPWNLLSFRECRFVELFYLFISMGWGYLSCCHNLKSFHSSPFHFFSLFVILLALTNGRFCQGDANHCCTFKTTGNSIIESIHVVREKTLADGSQTSNFLIAVSYNLCLTNGGCRFVL